MSALSLSLLGNFKAFLDDRPLTQFRTNKVQALLIYLVTETAVVHQREALMTLLWPDLPLQSARINLRQILYQLRKMIPELSTQDGAGSAPFILAKGQTVQVNPDVQMALDLHQFTQLLADCQSHDHLDIRACAACEERLETAVTLYRGVFLADFYLPDSNLFEDWAQAKRERLRRQMLDALDLLATIYMKQGKFARAEAEAWRQLEIDDLNERATRQLMEALARNGQRSEAMAIYDNCRTLFMEELGMAPTAKTTQLYEQILQDELDVEVAQTPDIRGYELLEEIGSGAFGVVHRAYQPVIDREVAIKIIKPKYANQPDFIRSFEAEAQTVARLEHPHIVPLYDYWREPDSAYLVMRWLRGGSLAAALAERPYEPETAVPLVEQIAAALNNAHRQGVIHRDVKPSNILLDEEGNAYLSDFGIARETNRNTHLTATNELVGSPAYISPEQLLNETITPATDIYSFGMVLYELLTGDKPFSTTSLVELIQKQVNEPLPPVQSIRPELATAVNEVIQRATAKKATDRYPNAIALASAFREAIQQNGQAFSITAAIAKISEKDIVNPYLGLRPFQETDSDRFFGREALVERLLSRLAASSSLTSAQTIAGNGLGGGQFLAVVGPSGSGKSSVVKAGLIPALRAGRLPGSENWFVAEMMPGTHPLEEMEAALLRIAVDPPASLLEPLQKDERGLTRVLKRILPQDVDRTAPSQLLLVIDQFEELFTLVEDEDERTHFINNLLAALAEPTSRLRLVVTLRADFYDRPLRFADLGVYLRANTEVVLPLTAVELEQAITHPAAQVGVSCEPALITAITADINDQPGALPLVQYTLTELFEQRDGRILTLRTYQELGGISGALARRADEIYTGLNENGREVTRQIFLRLVTLGEGVEDTRRRVRISELERLNQQLDDQDPLHPSSLILHNLNEYGRYRLLTFDNDPQTREPTVEVAHEALLREWDLLRGWLDESRADLRLQRLLAGYVGEWLSADKSEGYLLRGSRLDQFESWAAETTLALTTDEQALLATSIAARHQRDADEESRRQRELETAQQLAQEQSQRAEEQSRSASRLRRLAIGLAVVLLLAIGAAWLAIDREQAAQENANLAATREAEAIFAQAETELERLEAEGARATAIAEGIRADEERDTAVAAEATTEVEANFRATAEAVALDEREEALHQASIGLASQALSELEGKFPERAVPLALEALQDYPYTWQAERALGQAVLNNRLELILKGHTNSVTHLAWSPDSTQLATASNDNTAIVWDVQTGEMQLIFSEHSDIIDDLAWSPTGSKIATSSRDGTARVWTSDTGAEQFIMNHEDRVNHVAWSPDGDRIMTSSLDGTAKVWDATGGELQFTLLEGNETSLSAIAWFPTGNQVATGDVNGQINVWDSETGEMLFSLEGHENSVNQILWSPAGDQIATASHDLTARVWDAVTGNPLHTFTGHTNWVANVGWSSAGDRIVTSSEDASVRMWDATNGENIFIFDPGDPESDPNYPSHVAWSPDGEFLATNRFDGNITILNAATGGVVYHLTGQTTANNLAWSPDGNHLATNSEDGTTRVWDVSPRGRLLKHDGVLTHSSWSPSGDRLATASWGDGTVKIWDAETWQELLYIAASEAPLWQLIWDATGEHFITLSMRGEIKVWDAITGAELLFMEVSRGGGGLSMSPTGAQFVSGNTDGIARIWDTKSGELLLNFEGHDGASMTSADWSPDGKQIVTSDNTNQALIWDAESGEILLTLRVDESPGLLMTQAIWSPDGKRIATHSDDGVGGRIWDATTGEQLQTFRGHTSSVWSLEWSNSGEQILTAAGDATARLWDAESGAELLVYTFADWPSALWSPDNKQIAFPLGDGSIWIVDVRWNSPKELIDYARECCLIRELTPEERVQFGLPPEP